MPRPVLSQHSHVRNEQVNIPADAVAYQIGETAQILTGGLLSATPHMVQVINAGPAMPYPCSHAANADAIFILIFRDRLIIQNAKVNALQIVVVCFFAFVG
jgi:hypothetical protein